MRVPFPILLFFGLYKDLLLYQFDVADLLLGRVTP